MPFPPSTQNLHRFTIGWCINFVIRGIVWVGFKLGKKSNDKSYSLVKRLSCEKILGLNLWFMVCIWGICVLFGGKIWLRQCWCIAL